MTKTFLHEDFLLESPQAKRLYHDYAANLPIIDYHCHLSPAEIAENRQFTNLTQIWLAGDHYKWRAMRTCGVDERYITGNASDWEKFEKWAATVPKTLRNPLYHWTHLELKRPFGISDRLLNPSTARWIWDACNEKLATADFSTQGILRQMHVEVVCTTDDPVDDLQYHEKFRRLGASTTRMYPAFRPDKALAFAEPSLFLQYLAKLGAAAGVTIRSYEDFLEALRKRHQYFHNAGCRLSDHGLETIVFEEYSSRDISAAFKALLNGETLSRLAVRQLTSAVLHELALLDHAKGWVQQYHLGAFRNNNSRMFMTLGPDTGFDSIGDMPLARETAKFLDRLDKDNRLAKTILYNLHPAENEVIATMIGNFQDGSVPGKMQFGSAWWFLDQLDGMTKQIEALSSMGLLSQFVGMLTDSRSFLSYTRHEYFRRLLCSILGEDMRRGLIPDDLELVGSMVRDISYYNAQRYFPFEKVEETKK